MIELKNITKTYRTEGGGNDFQALRGVSLKIEPGDFVAIMGPSGSGKSTLLHILGFLDRPDGGSYVLGGRDISRVDDDGLAAIRNHIAGFVFQQFHLLPRLSALQNAVLPLIYAGKRGMEDKAVARLTDVGLSHRVSHRPNQLSGGEQQRVAIARSLVNDPIIIFADEPTGNLDTKSESEILQVLEKLNAEGKTIVMVTHEREVAERARRIVFMRDGKIVTDERTSAPKPAPTLDEAGVRRALSANPQAAGRAEFADQLRQAVDAIVSHKMRSALSVLGILIGVGAVIAMLALGEGAKSSIAARLASLGSNLLTIRPGSIQNRGVAMEAGSVTRFTIADAQAIEKLPEIRRASPSVRGRGQVAYGAKNWNTQVQGVGAEYETMRASTPTSGRFFNDDETRMRARVALVGQTLVRELYEGASPIGSTLKINRVNFKVIGVLPEKGSGGFGDDDDVVLVPITTAMYRLLGKQYVDSIDVEVKDASWMQEAEDAVRKMIIQRRRLDKKNEDSFQIRNMTQIQETLSSTTKTMTWLLGSIAAISLLVGGIGIMNIMLVSVTERTREIGLRKAIGARKSDIIRQFLIESVVMTLCGGLIGVTLGVGAAFAFSKFAGWTVKVSLFPVVLSTVFSAAVGILFGLWPAKQAAALDPIRALRYE